MLKTAILALVIGSAVRQTGPLLCIEGSFVQGYVNPGLRANLRLTYNSRPDKYLTELTAAWKYPTIFFEMPTILFVKLANGVSHMGHWETAEVRLN